jgi:hypothetical protein
MDKKVITMERRKRKELKFFREDVVGVVVVEIRN